MIVSLATGQKPLWIGRDGEPRLRRSSFLAWRP